MTQYMIESLPFVGINTFIVSVAILIVSAFVLRNTRRSAELAEYRMEYLREEQVRLAFLHEERRSLREELERERELLLEAQQRAERIAWKHPAELERKYDQLAEELERVREQHMEAQRQAERLRQECLSLDQKQRQSAEGLEQERANHLEARWQARQEHEGWERERSERRHAERRADNLEQELRELRQKGLTLDQEKLTGDLGEPPELLEEELYSTQETAERMWRPAAHLNRMLPR